MSSDFYHTSELDALKSLHIAGA